MNWKALKNNKCPKCGSGPLISSGSYYRCPNQKQGVCFLIGTEKFKSLVDKIYQNSEAADRKYDREFDEQLKRDEELNNLGRKEVTDDFSDSEFI